jgi:DNA primase
MPGVRFDEVRARVSMAQVLELLGFVAQARTGASVRGPCPVHGSRSARRRCFSAHLGRGIYRCFQCGSAGNHLDLYAAATRQGLHAAAIDLCGRAGCAVPWISNEHPRRTPRGALEAEREPLHLPS